MSAPRFQGMALVVASDTAAAEAAIRQLLPTALVELVVTAKVPHLLVRVPLSSTSHWQVVRAALARLATAAEHLVVAVAPRADAEAVEHRRARAQALLPLATRLPAPRRLLDVDELTVYDVLVASRSPAQASLVRDVLGPILRQPGEGGRKLLATLDTLHWHNGSAKSAARALGVHVKTVHNRLRRIEQLTGLCLDHPPDRLRLEVALYVLRATEAGLGVNPRVDGPSAGHAIRTTRAAKGDES